MLNGYVLLLVPLAGWAALLVWHWQTICKRDDDGGIALVLLHTLCVGFSAIVVLFACVASIEGRAVHSSWNSRADIEEMTGAISRLGHRSYYDVTDMGSSRERDFDLAVSECPQAAREAAHIALHSAAGEATELKSKRGLQNRGLSAWRSGFVLRREVPVGIWDTKMTWPDFDSAEWAPQRKLADAVLSGDMEHAYEVLDSISGGDVASDANSFAMFSIVESASRKVLQRPGRIGGRGEWTPDDDMVQLWCVVKWPAVKERFEGSQ